MLHLRRLASALLLVLLSPPVLFAAALPGGILDLTGRTGYFSTSNGIDAISLTLGDRLWSTTEAQQPLLATVDRLYALALSKNNILHVRGFDLMNGGKRIYQSSRIDLPAWVVTGEAPRHSFRCTWQLEKAILHLSWQARAWADSGPAKEAAGVVRIDLDSGAVRIGPTGPLIPPPSPLPRKELEKRSVRWQRSIGGQLHVLVQEDVPGASSGRVGGVVGERKSRLVLRTWNEKTGKQGQPHELLRGARPVVMPGLDGIQLWVRDAAVSPDQQVDENIRRSRWAVYSVLDGNLVARVPFIAGTKEATLYGGRAFCLATAPSRATLDGVPTRRTYTLHVIDLESGKILWERPLSSKAIAP